MSEENTNSTPQFDFQTLLIFFATATKLIIETSHISQQKQIISRLLKEPGFTINIVEQMFNVNLHNPFSPTYIRLLEDNVNENYKERKNQIESTFNRLYKMLPDVSWLNLDNMPIVERLLKEVYKGNVQLGLSSENKSEIDEYYRILELGYGNPLSEDLLNKIGIKDKLLPENTIIFIDPIDIYITNELIKYSDENGEITIIRYNEFKSNAEKITDLKNYLLVENPNLTLEFEDLDDNCQFIYNKYEYDNLLSDMLGKNVLIKTPVIKVSVKK